MTTLRVENVIAGYGSSRVLDGLSFQLDGDSAVIIGRNGMGKTTLCKVLMGLLPVQSGSITLDGVELAGATSRRVVKAGVAYVPQGRRLFPSLTVDEHLAMLEPESRGKKWTAAEVYRLFPRLAERKRNGGAELSGGEQQMLAVGRALLLNTPLIVMDEPSEGLAPLIVDLLIDTIHRLIDDGTSVLVVEQNLGAATAMADRQLVMVAGRIETEMAASALAADTEAQRRYLGVDT
ncbi:MAG: ABC transporter ATP-binding protein [Actinomycetota bacterium]